MTSDLQHRINSIKAECRKALELSEKATPGPWDLGDENNQHAQLAMQHGKINLVASFDRLDRYARGDDYAISREEMLANVEFCYFSRTFSPATAQSLLTAIEALEEVDNHTQWSQAGCMAKRYAIDGLQRIAYQWEGR